MAMCNIALLNLVEMNVLLLGNVDDTKGASQNTSLGGVMDYGFFTS